MMANEAQDCPYSRDPKTPTVGNFPRPNVEETVFNHVREWESKVA